MLNKVLLYNKMTVMQFCNTIKSLNVFLKYIKKVAVLDFKNWGGGGGLVWANQFSKSITQ